MLSDMTLLHLTAVTVGFFHTLLGPDHYVPFVAMAKVGRWSLFKTLTITFLCGLGHVGSSVVLGGIGIAFGLIVNQLEAVESVRNGVASWLLIGFGLAYLTWGILQAVRNIPHTHLHAHLDGTVHAHDHRHQGEHLHVHAAAPAPVSGGASATGLTPWVLMVIFLFGPCEPLIPILMYPAKDFNLWAVATVSLLFAAATLVTMLSVVTAMHLRLSSVRLHGVQRFSHALAGAAVLACGLAIKLGL